MTTTAPIPPITGTVAAPVEQAFRVFAGPIDSWWPHRHHIGRAEVVPEPRVGGRWYERGVDGTGCGWGRVLAGEPPHRLVSTGQIDGAIRGGGWVQLLAGFVRTVAGRA